MSDSPNHIHLKKEILIRLARAFASDDFEESVRLIPFDMRPKGCPVPYRCCIHRERAILRSRVIAGLGFSIESDDERTSLNAYARAALARERPEPEPLTILSDACNGCPPNRIFVTDLCQGCVARPCQSVCKFGAIGMEDGRSVIDPAKCKKCKMCMSACPYHAIAQITVPCEDNCPVSAIQKDEQGLARIDFKKCIGCGKCVSACPFGAVHEKSQLVDLLSKLKKGREVVAMVAPAIVGQFPGTIRQLRTAMLRAGFSDVAEVASGADETSRREAVEFAARMKEGAPFMTTSCCAAYNNLAAIHLPEIRPYVSSTGTPLHYAAERVKKDHPGCTSVFISPCVAKKIEGLADPNVDYVINFEELGALFVALKVEILDCEESAFTVESSKQGRGFGITHGVAAAIGSLAPEAHPCYVNGITKDSVRQLRGFALKGSCPDCNLIEVMGCEGGCVGGNATINKTKVAVKIIGELLAQSEDLKA